MLQLCFIFLKVRLKNYFTGFEPQKLHFEGGFYVGVGSDDSDNRKMTHASHRGLPVMRRPSRKLK